MATELEMARRERDLLLRLLELGGAPEPSQVLTAALALLSEISEAKRAYIELWPAGRPGEGEPRWSVVHALSGADLQAVRAFTSSGIVAAALAQGQTVQTASAREDPRFDARDSVRRNAIQAVLCVPLGSAPPSGVIYLEGSRGGGPFSPDVRHLTELFGRHIEPVIEHLLCRVDVRDDPTRVFRQQLDVDGLLGRSPAFAALLREISLIAPLDVSVLITGPSGSGKSRIARAIAANSPRRRRPFVALNCAAIPDELVESELFGALPGAHSTAYRRRRGKVAAAEGGTLFLDEVGELSERAQAKLLQLIQDKTYYPLGGSRLVHADVRILAATKLDLRAHVDAGRFREDLYYRLKVLPLVIPPLSERDADIPELVRHFAQQACLRMKCGPLTVADEALAAARAAAWPGHIRQLANTVEAAVLRAHGDGATVVRREHLWPSEAPSPPPTPVPAPGPSYHEATRRFQRRLVSEALDDAAWNVSEAARRLGLTRTHLYNLIRAFGLRRP